MSKKSGVYPVEFRNQMVELVRSGRSAAELAREFGCHSTSISGWVHQAQIDEAGAGRLDARSHHKNGKSSSCYVGN